VQNKTTTTPKLKKPSLSPRRTDQDVELTKVNLAQEVVQLQQKCEAMDKEIEALKEKYSPFCFNLRGKALETFLKYTF